jgi:hypothetical protein
MVRALTTPRNQDSMRPANNFHPLTGHDPPPTRAVVLFSRPNNSLEIVQDNEMRHTWSRRKADLETQEHARAFSAHQWSASMAGRDKSTTSHMPDSEEMELSIGVNTLGFRDTRRHSSLVRKAEGQALRDRSASEIHRSGLHIAHYRIKDIILTTPRPRKYSMLIAMISSPAASQALPANADESADPVVSFQAKF